MRIKSIDICGFKSFFNRTSLSFLPGITALVGPNGCGKSNIVDAIRWALGEQSAKQLRGNLMEDVIFNGSRQKKPLSMAEVSVVFANDNGNAPIQYKDFAEIEVTRRVFRNGESEYYINKTPCRLKDITELFLDTGVGARAYSIIEQSRVEAIINSKPQELRVLIEEAAGISKFKARKQEALRKMDATRQNLIRVKDVLGEIEKQLNSLSNQAKKLKRFKALKDKIRSLELALTSRQYLSLSNLEAQKRTELEKLKGQQEILMAEEKVLGAELVAKKAGLQEEEEKFSVLQKKKMELEYLLREEENNLTRKNEKIADLENQRENTEKAIEENLLRLKLEEEEVARAEVLKFELQEKLQEIENNLKAEEEIFSQLKKELAAVRTNLESKKEELFEIRYEISRRENNIDHGTRTQKEYQRRLEQNEAETFEAQRRYKSLRDNQVIIIQELEKIREEQKRLESEKELLLIKISQLQSEIKELTDSITAGKENLARLESQKESLQELQRNFEGCSEGVRSILQKRKEIGVGNEGILGIVADFIETEPRFEVAVESVLGDKLQYVIVKSQAEGVEAVKYLTDNSSGRGSFIPLKTEKLFTGKEPGEDISSFSATPLINLIKVKDGFEHIIRYLIGKTLVVEDLPQALTIWGKTPSYTIVTLNGEVIDPFGVITGGNHNGIESRFLKRNREIRELGEKIVSLTEQLSHLQSHKEEKDRELSECQSALKYREELLIQQKLSLQHKERDLSQNREESERIKRKMDFLVLEKKKLEGELREIEEELEKLLSEREELIARQSARENDFNELQNREKDCQQKIASQEVSFNHWKNGFIDLKTQISSISSTLELRKRSIEQGKNEISKGKKYLSELTEELTALKEEVKAAITRIDEITKLYQQQEEMLSSQSNKLEELRQELFLVEEKLKNTRQEYHQLYPIIQALDHELAQYTTEIHFLEEKIKNKYQVSLKEVVAEYYEGEYSEEELRVQLEKLEQAQLRMMEGINFNAEREYEEQVEKHRFYQTQAEDLEKALNSLQEAIQKINRTSRERFRDTFYRVNENFQKIIPLVFEGGKGELILTDENDLLETGVEIMVQPGGKSLRHISLLSGGEKALAAISLLFSLYLIKPTPFCLLDEIDSPLDDANVDRFIAIIKQFAPNSQFIIITHNKKTMEIADTLYGITMEEPGVSKVVSVRLN